MSKFSVGQMNQLGDALERAGFTPGDLTRLQQFKELPKILAVLNGSAEIVFRKEMTGRDPYTGEAIVIEGVSRIVDCDAEPFVPANWKVESHSKGGQFEWSQSHVELYLDEAQCEEPIVGHDLYYRLTGKDVLNACILDYLIEHQYLIPRSWKNKRIHFWGTIYRDEIGNLWVPFLYWAEDVRYQGSSFWIRDYQRLTNAFELDDYAALGK